MAASFAISTRDVEIILSRPFKPALIATRHNSRRAVTTTAGQGWRVLQACSSQEHRARRSAASSAPLLRTAISLDGELLEKARQLPGPLDRTALLQEALRAEIERESAKRLAWRGGTVAVKAATRRRATPMGRWNPQSKGASTQAQEG
jgi:post-segregation antitoxin (ccd killing protein)